MINYKDKAFCASPGCKNDCSRRMTDAEREETRRVGFPIAWGYFCGLPKIDIEAIKYDVRN